MPSSDVRVMILLNQIENSVAVFAHERIQIDDERGSLRRAVGDACD